MPSPARAAKTAHRVWSGIPGGTRLLMIVCATLTILFSVATHFFIYPFLPAGGSLVAWPAEWMVLNPQTLPGLRLSAVATSGLIAAPTGLIGLLILLLIVGYFMQDTVRYLWRARRVTLIGGVVGFLAFAAVADWILLPGGFASGLLASLVVLGWIGGALEQMWGRQRYLRFAAIVLLGSHLLGALMLWIWPNSYVALLGSGAAPPVGTQPLVAAMLAVQGFAIGHRQLNLLPMKGYHIVILMVAIGALDMLFRGAVSGFLQLAAIGIAWLLIRGLWRPRYLLDRVRLFFIDRRLARRKRKLTLIDGGRSH